MLVLLTYGISSEGLCTANEPGDVSVRGWWQGLWEWFGSHPVILRWDGEEKQKSGRVGSGPEAGVSHHESLFRR